MIHKLSFFTKINILIILLVAPILVLYGYSNRVSINVVSEELKRSNHNQLSFLLSQMESKIQQVMLFALTFRDDPSVIKFKGLDIADNPYDETITKRVILDKLMQQNLQTGWSNHFSVYATSNREMLSSSPRLKFDSQYLASHISSDWQYRPWPFTNDGEFGFFWYTSDSYSGHPHLNETNLVIETAFNASNIRIMLDKFKGDGRGDPFLFRSKDEVIRNGTANAALINELIGRLDPSDLDRMKSRMVAVGGQSYLVTAVKSPTLHWYLIDYVAMKTILAPISLSRNLFYTCIALLMLLSFTASLLIYRHIQIPIKQLVKSVRIVRRGDYSSRIKRTGPGEFQYLFDKFNEMSSQIKELIENVYAEKLRAREATLKQLQSQINPHFLYNCLGFIINMAKLKDEQAVVSMAHSMSDYYRYTTRLEKHTATVKEEIRMNAGYLDIQALRMERLRYRIDIPEQLELLNIPKLTLQPIVENAIVHGIAKKSGSGEIRIGGEIGNDGYRIVIEDDGAGLTMGECRELERKWQVPMEEDTGFGMWNVHQRILHQFGEGSGLRLELSAMGGLKVIVQINKTVQGE